MQGASFWQCQPLPSGPFVCPVLAELWCESQIWLDMRVTLLAVDTPLSSGPFVCLLEKFWCVAIPRTHKTSSCFRHKPRSGVTMCHNTPPDGTSARSVTRDCPTMPHNGETHAWQCTVCFDVHLAPRPVDFRAKEHGHVSVTMGYLVQMSGIHVDNACWVLLRLRCGTQPDDHEPSDKTVGGSDDVLNTIRATREFVFTMVFQSLVARRHILLNNVLFVQCQYESMLCTNIPEYHPTALHV